MLMVRVCATHKGRFSGMQLSEYGSLFGRNRGKLLRRAIFGESFHKSG